MLTKDRAIRILMDRYSISRIEATDCWESDMRDLRIFSRDAFGKRIQGIKTSFQDEDDYTTYLELLEADNGVNDSAYNYLMKGGM